MIDAAKLSGRGRMLRAFKTALLTIADADLAGLTVRRNPHARVQAFPALAMFDPPHGIEERSDSVDGDDGDNLYVSEIEIEGYVAHSDGDQAGDQLDLLWRRLVQAVLADRTLGGTATDLFEGERLLIDQVEGEPGVKPHLWFQCSFLVHWQATATDPGTAP